MRYLCICLLTCILLIYLSNSVHAEIKQASGKLIFLRIHENFNVKPNKKITVIIDSEPNKIFSITVIDYSNYNHVLADHNNHISTLLERSFDNNQSVVVEYNYEPGMNEFAIINAMELK